MIAIVGGTYNEICFHPEFNERYGSGLRACYAIRHLDKVQKIEFHTYCNKANETHLNNFGEIFDVITKVYPSENSIGFYYDHPLRTPEINPRPDLIVPPKDELELESTNILYYGFLEGNAKVKGNKVVYDPQSPVKPVSFKGTGSTANELAVVVNFNEAFLITKSRNLEEIKKYFFEVDGASVLVVKMGPKGAKVFTATGESRVIPVYKTSSVWPIGSGDVFASIFAYHWMGGKDAFEAAEKASFSTAIYCNTKSYKFEANKDSNDIVPLKINEYPKGKVYLAGPFFNYAEKWVVNEIYRELKGLGLNVFSPLHDVGVGAPNSNVAHDDLVGLDECKIVFAIVDGLDSGTLFEIGYAKKMGIPVIAYNEHQQDKDLTMLIGSGMEIESDLTTALYKCLWMLAEKENE